MLATTQIRNASLRILLADPDYNEYLLFRNLLSPDRELQVGLLWCGELDRLRAALRTGFYDVVLMCRCDENLAALESVAHDGCATPVVILDDAEAGGEIPPCAQVLGALDRRRPQCEALKRYLQRVAGDALTLRQAACRDAPGDRAGDNSTLQ